MRRGADYHSSVKRRDRQQLPPADAGVDQASEADTYDRPSKSQRKRDSHALQDLGERLLALQPAKLRALPIPSQLLDAIELARRITSREGLRRQRQYIGRLMRDVDPTPILAVLDDDGATHRAEVATMHAAERWRERLLESPDLLPTFLAQHSEADAAALSELIAAARTEVAQGAPGRRFRELYRSLRDLLAQP